MLKALAFWCFYALEDEEPDDSVLEKLGFGSVDAMRIQSEIGRFLIGRRKRLLQLRMRRPQTMPQVRKRHAGLGR
jgi:hypothetical protein